MATNTPLQSITLTSAQSVVTFAGIPQDYTDLVIQMNCGISSTGQAPQVYFNGDASGGYSNTYLNGNGSSATSGRTTAQPAIHMFDAVGNGNTNLESFVTCHVFNYAGTTNKAVLYRARHDGLVTAGAGYKALAAPITSVSISATSGNFAVGSTFDLYGISTNNAKIASASGGTAIYYDSTYAYHVFTTTGTFTPARNLTCDYLVVAGGGGGGSYSAAGGGGAGGLRSTIGATGGGGTLESAASLTANTTYTITVGAGGTGAFNTATGFSGTASSIAGSGLTTISTVGGGYGGGYNGGHYSAVSGGSGGGANYNPGTNTGASGTANQGYAGGNGVGGVGGSSGGGGGGAGSVGGNAITGLSPSGQAGDGGAGVLITGMATATGTGVGGYYAGGGGGSSYDGARSGFGGVGGGGAGAVSGSGNKNGTSGVTNTGAGGGAARTVTAPPSDAWGGNGGSGIVIVRYVR